MASEQEILALLVVLLLRHRRGKAHRPKMCAREWILKCWQQGAYPNLLRELHTEETFKRGTLRFAVLVNFSCGISVILILNCVIAVFSESAG